MSITKRRLEDLIKQGLVADIFRMERSYALLKVIGTNAEAINAPSAGNFGELFGALQSALQTDTVLAVARLYDPPSKRYPTRCIKGLLDFLEENRSNLPNIGEFYNLEKELNRIGINPNEIQLALADETCFVLVIVNHFRMILKDEQTIDTIEKLKNIRDKIIAHNEQVSHLHGPTWYGLEKLIQHAKDLAGLLGWAYFSTVYVHDGEYLLTLDAGRASIAMNRLLKQVIPTLT